MTTTQEPAPTRTAPTAANLLDQVRAERSSRDAAEVRILVLALDWAHRHVIAPADPEPPQVSHLEQQPCYGLDSEHALSARERLVCPSWPGTPGPRWVRPWG